MNETVFDQFVNLGDAKALTKAPKTPGSKPAKSCPIAPLEQVEAAFFAEQTEHRSSGQRRGSERGSVTREEIATLTERVNSLA